MSFSSRLFGRIYKFERDPERVGYVFRTFSERRGFREYEARCRAAFSRNGILPRESLLERQGFEHVDLMSPSGARQLLERLQAEHPVVAVKKNNRKLLGFADIAESTRRDIFDAVLARVDEKLAAFFGSEYLVLWMTVTVTQPAARQQVVSFRWHCDKGPRNHLKVIMYLNGSGEHGGNTEFLDLADSTRVAKEGYVFGSPRSRTDRVERLARLAGAPLRVRCEPIAAGSGVVFQPAAVLHRGVSPTLTPRYAVTLCLLPSPVHWTEAFALGAGLDLGRDEKWPEHAADLERMLERP